MADNPTTGPYIQGRPIPLEDQGKCFTCGFLRLAVPVHEGTDYREMDWLLRLGHEPCLVRIQSNKRFPSVQPTTECLMGIADLPDEIGQEASRQHGDFERAALVVFKKVRKCQEWQLYSRGKPIQQYYAEDFMQRLEELRQQFQADREQAREEFFAEMDRRRGVLDKARFEAEQRAQNNSSLILAGIRQTTEENKILVSDIKSLAERSDQFSRRVTIWIVTLAVVQTLSSLAALYLGYQSLRASNISALLDALERLLTR